MEDENDLHYLQNSNSIMKELSSYKSYSDGGMDVASNFSSRSQKKFWTNKIEFYQYILSIIVWSVCIQNDYVL